MISRPLWKKQIEGIWQKVPIAWLTGVRRAGKTTLAQEFAAEYLNCDLPSVNRRLEDPEEFFKSVSGKVVIFDEVHQLPDPSRVLKIAADEFKNLRILATGSSTLQATEKFRDSLAGRKRVVHLVPVLFEELKAFGIDSLELRLLRGGLPPSLLSPGYDSGFFSEWMDSYFARDVQELFRVEKRTGFLKLLELLLRQSGGQFDATSMAKLSGLSRPTVYSYLDVLEATNAISILRPFAGGGRREIVAQPKVYGFDTGFVAHARGWDSLRTEDCGALFEQIVLETLQSIPSLRAIHYWRDKQQREVDFVIPTQRSSCDAIECKWNVDAFEARNLKAFRESYPQGRNILVAPNAVPAFSRTVEGMKIEFVSPSDLRGLWGEQI